MSRMRFRSEFVDRQIVDSNEPNAAFDEELGALRLEINKFLEKFAVLPVL